MAPYWWIPGVVFLVGATILNAIAAVSLPYLSDMEIVRVNFHNGAASTGSDAVNTLKLGVWAYCWDLTAGGDQCSATGHGYSVTVHDTKADSFVIIGPSWTRGLAVHPVAAGVSFLAFLFSLSTHVTITLIASLVSFLAAVLTLIAFAIDIALLAWTSHEMAKLSGLSSSTNTAPGFWLTFVAFILLLFAGCTVCFGRRRDRMYGATTYPSTYAAGAPKRRGFFSRFRRN